MKSQSGSIFSTEEKPTARHSDAGNLFIVPYPPQALEGCAGPARWTAALAGDAMCKHGLRALAWCLASEERCCFPQGVLPLHCLPWRRHGERKGCAWASPSGRNKTRILQRPSPVGKTRSTRKLNSSQFAPEYESITGAYASKCGGKRSEDSPSGSIRPWIKSTF